jgi:hypothetical protein
MLSKMQVMPMEEKKRVKCIFRESKILRNKFSHFAVSSRMGNKTIKNTERFLLEKLS